MSIRFTSSDTDIDVEGKNEANRRMTDNKLVHLNGKDLPEKKILRSILKSTTSESDKGVDNDTFVYDDNSDSEDEDNLLDDDEHISATVADTQPIKIDGDSKTELSVQREIKPELQNYLEILRSSGKIEKVAIVDLYGKILVRSIGMGITEGEAYGVLCVLKSSDKTLAKIRIGKHDYTCFKNSPSSFVGNAENDFLHVRICLDFIIICTSDPNSPGSSIYEVSRFVKRCYRTSNIISDD